MNNLKISTKKTKVMALKGKSPGRAKIIIDNNILREISHFSYLKSVKTHTLRRTFKTKTKKETQQKLCKLYKYK
jgi:hypothetical protein